MRELRLAFLVKMMNKWISVKDELPPAGKEVPFVDLDEGKQFFCYGFKSNDDPDSKQWMDELHTDRDCMPMDCYGVTHWMKVDMPEKEENV